jgi:glycosyltransferase involved in cell wall biosynthesis
MKAELHTTERSGPPGQESAVRSIFKLAPVRATAERRIALVGNYLPRKCGIATFTADICEKLREFHPNISVDVYALDDPHRPMAYDGVDATIAYDDPADYAETARRINESGVDAIWLQHEYGIFGGADGEMVLDFVDRLAAPLILTPHTVLGEPSPRQLAILRHLVARSSRIMVMSRHARDLLAEHYGAPHEILEVVPHGGPDRPFGRQAEFKARLGLTGHTVLTTFGLLGPGKGLEIAIEALPAIVGRHPDVVYRIVGETHPNLVATEGEAYRERLQALAGELGVADHIQWENRFLQTEELLDQLEACDIYITPYPGMQQSTSGTLSYAVALGKAVVSTPYLHARELLADAVGEIVEPSSGAIAAAINRLLDDPQRLSAMQRRAYARGRETIWPRFADGAAELIEHAAVPSVPRPAPVVSAPAITAVVAMSDTTGLLQHAIGIVPDRAHGYCLDDNARALMLMNVAEGIDPAERTRWRQIYASFVQHAWNPDVRGFRNFMRFDRSWCEDVGSEDSNGRALWALGQTFATANEPSLRFWAKGLYDAALPHCSAEGSPRAVAFTMLGAAALLRQIPDHGASRDYLRTGADFLHRLLDASRRPDWAWFEAMLGYDNPRLSQALLEAGLALGEARYRDAGLDSLTWIAERQIAGNGHFRPIGSDTFGHAHTSLPYDQQPLEAQAAIEAAAAAWQASGDPVWQHHGLAAWRWFFGANDRGVALANLATGRCRDGINPRGVNENCGAESILAFQLAYYSLIGLLRGNQSDSTESRRASEPTQRLAKPAAHT